MYNNKSISVIIPCKNEAEVIGSLIAELPSCVDEVIVVNNNSTDNTFQEAFRAGAIVVEEKRTVDGIGYGFAHQTGLSLAQGEYLVALDGDKTYPASEIPQIIDCMEKNQLDFVSCNRFPLKNSHSISKTRQLGIQILNWETLFLYGYPIKDILTGMWVAKKEVVKKLGIKEGGWDLSPEIKLAALNHPEVNFAEYHIPAFIRDGNLSKQKIWKTGWGHLLYILKRRLTTDSAFFQIFTSLSEGFKYRFGLNFRYRYVKELPK
jgi:glycosyltransferase involved in cell wall biosynthesis